MASKSGYSVDFSECSSYETFKQKLHYHRRNSKMLNDHVSDKLDKDALSEQLRGSFIQVVAIWEQYVQNILQEIVETVFKFVSNSGSAQAALSTASCKDLYKRAMVHHILDDSAKRRDSGDDKPRKKVANLTKREASTVELSISLLTQPDLWKVLLDTYREVQLKRCDRVSPLLHGEDGIDSKFKSLFDTTKCLSDIMIEMGPVKWSFRVKSENHASEVSTSQSLNDVLRLYYGARCAFSHGQTDRTFQPGGALYKFPLKREFQNQVGEVTGDYLYILYKYVKEYGREAWVQYPTLVNLQRFIKAIAFRLLAAISKWVYDEFGLCIWNFDPDKLEAQNTLMNDDESSQS